MFFGLNINYYIAYMKKELFGGAVFVSIVIGMNYILKHFLLIINWLINYPLNSNKNKSWLGGLDKNIGVRTLIPYFNCLDKDQLSI